MKAQRGIYRAAGFGGARWAAATGAVIPGRRAAASPEPS